MPESELSDAVARDEIEHHLDVTLFVEAGAGSGKTTALVRRIVALITSGAAPISTIAAVTFTEAAAAELRVRVREGLEERRKKGGLSSEEAGRVAEALGRLDEAPISTIHGFCSRILASYPIEAGLPPQFEILGEVAEAIEWRRRWSAEVDELAGDPDLVGLVSIGFALGVDDRRLQTLARCLDDEWQRCHAERPDSAAALAHAEETAQAGIERILAVLEQARAALVLCRDDTDLLCSQLRDLAGHAGDLAGSGSVADAIEVLVAQAEHYRSPNGQNRAWKGEVAAVREIVEEARRLRLGLLAQLHDIVIRALAAHLEFRTRKAAEKRRTSGTLTFHDLLVLTRELLRSSRAVREAVRRRFSHILIDEFQDTDPLQLEIARLLATGEKGWEPGRCFFVGDPKQSIYRFRGADLLAYKRARDEIARDALTSLTSNFRARPEILDVVNDCFAELLGEDFELLVAARECAAVDELGGGVGNVVVIGSELDKSLRRRQQRQLESADCARVIARAVTDGWVVEDPESGIARPARLGDVAILVPRRTGLIELERALDEAGIGFQVESASLILKSQEVRDVLALARALAEPGDHLALVATLRSPAYSIGDDELLRWKNAGGGWSIEEEAPPAAAAAAPGVAAALADIVSLRTLLEQYRPADALAAAVRRRRLLPLAAVRPHAREAWRRIRYVLERARLFDEAGGGGLVEFADWIDEQLDGSLRASESVVPDADEDVVKIMTVHGAKGLEFPITVLCGLGTNEESNIRPTVLRHPGEGTGCEVSFLKDLATRDYDSFYQQHKVLEAEETARLLYVAATRARDYLVVCAHRTAGGSIGQRLLELLAARDDLVLELAAHSGDIPVAPPEEPPPSARAPAGVATIGEYDAWRLRRERLLAQGGRTVGVRATDVAGLADEKATPEEDTPEEEGDLVPAVAGRGRAGTKIGRAVHATLQSISLADARALGGQSPPVDAVARLERVAAAQANAELVSDRAREVERLARAALSSETVREAFSSGRARREVYVAAPLDSRVLDGFVDLCFVRDDGSLVVVDYKTDAYSADSFQEKIDRYELQIAAYALALTEATGRPVSECVLVFLRAPSDASEHHLVGDELAARTAAVRGLVAAAS